MSNKQREEAVKAGSRLLLPFLSALCLLAVGVMIYVLAAGPVRSSETGFVPPPFEENAKTGTPDVPEELGWGQLDAQAFQVSICGEIICSRDSADVWLTNPADSQVWLKLRVLDVDGSILGETGLLRPGEYVQSVALAPVPEEGTQVVLKLMAYEPDTCHSAGAVSLNTTIRKKS